MDGILSEWLDAWDSIDPLLAMASAGVLDWNKAIDVAPKKRRFATFATAGLSVKAQENKSPDLQAWVLIDTMCGLKVARTVRQGSILATFRPPVLIQHASKAEALGFVL